MAARVLLILALLFSFASCYANNPEKNQGPVVSATKMVDPFTLDFGKVKQGEVLKHSFILKNDSTKLLNIKDVHTSCGCTASKAGKKTLAPGESTAIDVSFNTKGYSGQVAQFIYVNTDSVDKPVIRFMIKAEVVK
jgi:hypothetical protein